MKQTKPIHITNRSHWREWLTSNFKSANEVWLLYPKKNTGKPRLGYNSAVEEALCFGWIDSIVKKFDDKHTMQRFTPRNPKSSFSQPNKERIKWLLENGLLDESIIPTAQSIKEEKFIFPPDIIEQIKLNKKAWKHYQSFSEPYKRIRIAYIEAARKRPEEFQKRLANFIKKTEQGKLIKGYGGIDKYY